MRPDEPSAGRAGATVAVWLGRVGLVASLIGAAGQIRDPHALPLALVLVSLACSAVALARSRG
ncbi:MAG: hypothetical protein JNM60_11270 [Candidatus Competibacteraceae bacterium]|nr:hypothetical protein [Candidatus Competibacteraceae bacterium]